MVAAISLAPARETLPSSLWASIEFSVLDVTWVMAAGALLSRFSIVGLLLAVLTTDLAAFWLAAACWLQYCCAEFIRLVTRAVIAGFVVLGLAAVVFCCVVDVFVY